jgi:Fe-S cluster biogenesis protein NfuA/nitrite reductase/ring-hydroxylating ferredoxin subunit
VSTEGASVVAPADLRATGERIETLLDAAAGGGPLVRERAEELVRLVVDLYGAGLERMMEILYERGLLGDEVLDDLAGDDLVASLLLVHGLHPEGVAARVERALDGVRPYLASHHGDVELLEITDEGVVRLRLLGSCDGCASSSATLSLAVEGAVLEAAPEVIGIEVEAPTSAHPDVHAGALIPLESLIPVESLRVRRPGGAREPLAEWQPAPQLADLGAGQVLAFETGPVSLVACRIGSELFAFRDRCPACESGLGDAALERRLGSALGGGTLRCAACGAHYDVRAAGAGIDEPGHHLDAVPLLTRHGQVKVAVPRAVAV